MYKRHSIIAIILFCLSGGITAYYNFKMPEKIISDLITFFSIAFGFYLTSLSMMYGSQFTKRLASEADPQKKTKTKLYVLISYFKVSASMLILTIVLLLMTKMMGLTSNDNKILSECDPLIDFQKIDFCLTDIFSVSAFGLIVVNVFLMSILFKIFFNAFNEEGGDNV